MRQRLKGFRELIELHLALQSEREAAQKQAALEAEVAALDERLAGARQAEESAEAELKRLQVDKRTAEMEVQRFEQVRAKYKSQLMEAKTNEVYKTLLHEIETANHSISDHETRVLEVMEALDATQTNLARARRELETAKAVNEVEARKLATAMKDLGHEREEFHRRAAEIEPGVPADLLARMRRIAEQRGARGLARVEGYACTECHVAVRAQVWVELLSREDMYTCPGCKRILYRDENLRGDDAEVPEPPPETPEPPGDDSEPEAGAGLEPPGPSTASAR